MRTLLLWLAAGSLHAQMPTFGPDNPEGLVLFPNKTGRHAWLRKGTWTRPSIGTQSSRGPFAAVDAHAEAAKRLAALTPEDAARPACLAPPASQDGRYQIRGMIQISGSAPGCIDLVMDNWDYFDQKLPRVAPQILLVRSIGRCASVVDGKLVVHGRPPNDVPPQGCFKHVPMWEELDWKQLAALVVP